MFLGAALLGLFTNTTLVHFLSSQLPDVKDPDGIFDQSFKESYDYIVVGAGSAGSIIATRLSEDPVSVLLLEAGGSDIENEFTRIPFPWERTIGSELDWGYESVPQKYSYFADKDHKVFPARGKVLGGTGSINGMMYNRGSRYGYDNWKAEECTGWGYEDVLQYFKKSEDIRVPELMNSSFHGKGGSLVITETHLSPLEYFYRSAAKEKGLPVVDCNGGAQSGYCIRQANIKDGERCSSASCFLRPVLTRHNLQVAIYSHVTKIIVENGIATGVVVIRNGTTYTIKANKETILSAGVFGSPQILMLSGIGPKKHLQEVGVPVNVDLPVGSGMQDHMQILIHYSTNTSLNINGDKPFDKKDIFNYILYKTGILTESGNNGYMFAHLQNTSNKSRPPDIQISFLPPRAVNGGGSIECDVEEMNKMGAFGGTNRTAEAGFILLVSKLHHKSRGTVRLKNNDPLEPPLIDPQYLSHQEDLDSYVKVIRFVQDFANNTAWKSIGAVFVSQDECYGYCSNFTSDSDDYWKCMIRYYAEQSNHQTSTCRMGATNDTTAVVDPYLRVKEIKNLRVADSSVMRNVPSANTNAATMMIGEKAADMIKQARRHKTSQMP